MTLSLNRIKLVFVGCLIILTTYLYMDKDTYVRDKYPTMCTEQLCWDEAHELDAKISSIVLLLVTVGFMVMCNNKIIAALLSVPCSMFAIDTWERVVTNDYKFTVVDKIAFGLAIIILIYTLYPKFCGTKEGS